MYRISIDQWGPCSSLAAILHLHCWRKLPDGEELQKHAVRWTTFKTFTHWTFGLHVSNSEGPWRYVLATSSVFTLAVGWIFFKANTEKEDKEKKRNEGSFLKWQCRHGKDKSVLVRVRQTGQVVESLSICSHFTNPMARRRRCLLTLQSWSATCWPSLQQNWAAHKPSNRHHVWVGAAPAWLQRSDAWLLLSGGYMENLQREREFFLK